MKPPADDIMPTSFPKTRPHDETALYFQSKAEAKKSKRFPERDRARDSVNMSLYEARKAFVASETHLAEQRKKRTQKRSDFDEQLVELASKEESLKDSFAKFDKFVRENQDKRERAEKRIGDEGHIQQKRQLDVVHLTKDIEHLTSIKSQMDNRTKDYRMYEDYLASVAKMTRTFKNPVDIINRFEALIATKELLHATQLAAMDAFEAAKIDLAKTIKEKSLVLVGLRNKLADLRNRYDKAKSNSSGAETLLARVRDEACEKLLEITAVKTSCYNMYRTTCRRLRIAPTLPPENVEQHLLFVKKTLLDLREVRRAAKQHCDLETNSVKVEASSKK